MTNTPGNRGIELRGRPGKFPGSPVTVRIRVPLGTSAYIYWCLTELPSLLDDYRQSAKDTRNWTEFRRFSGALRVSQRQFIYRMVARGEITSLLSVTRDGDSIVFHTDTPKDID